MEAMSIRVGEDDRGTGWVLFAGALLMTLGVLNVIDGIAAVGDSSFFVRHARFVVGDLGSWGWVLVVIGVGQGLSGLAVSRRSEVGTWAGIGFALSNALAQMLVMQAYPWWSLAMFTLDLLVVYGLVVYGGRRLRPT
jgi:hypothetical protein